MSCGPVCGTGRAARRAAAGLRFKAIRLSGCHAERTALSVDRVLYPVFSFLRNPARAVRRHCRAPRSGRSEEHTSELQSLMRNSYAVFCLKKKKYKGTKPHEYT